MRKLLVLLAAVAFVFAFTTPAAADVNFYGYVGFWTGMDDQSKEFAGLGYDDSDLIWQRDEGNSRFGAKFKKGPFGANVEVRAYPGTSVSDRQFNASYNFGQGTLTIGQQWSNGFANIFGNNSLNVDMCSYGAYGGSLRAGQVHLTFGSLKIGLAKPAAARVIDAKGTTTYLATGPKTTYSTELDTSLPKIEVSYDLKAGPAAIKLFGGYNSYDEVDANDKSYGIDSYGLGGNVKLGFGATTVQATVWTVQNPAEYGLYNYAGTFKATQVVAGGTIYDVSGMGYGVNVSFKLSDTMSVQGGYGMVEYELDRPGTWEDEMAGYYVNLPITIAKGFTITPEFAVGDQKDIVQNGVSTEEGDITTYGVYWKINF